MKEFSVEEGTPYFPAVVALEVTLRCNLRCIHCGSNADHQPRVNELSLEEWKDVVNQLVDLGSLYLTLTGGEPMIWPHWRELCRHIREKEQEIAFITNGYRVLDEDIVFFKDVGVRNIAISLDGFEKTHNYIRQNPNSFQRSVDAVGRLRKAGIHVSVISSINKLNFDELEDFRPFLNDIGVNNWQIQVVNAFGRGGEFQEMLLIKPEQYVRLVEFIAETQEWVQKNGSQMVVLPGDSVGYCEDAAAKIWGEMEWTGCNAGRYVAGIQANGDVLGCLSLQHEIFSPAGNVRKQPLADIWKNDEGFAYNRNVTADQMKGCCSTCSFAEDCRSGCLSMGYSVSGELHHNPLCYKAIREKIRK